MPRSKIPRTRPQGVPEDARWNAVEGEWESGRTVQGKHVGHWRWWRPDGTLLCESTFDEAGLLHGAFARYHPNGQVARSGDFEHGTHVGHETFARSDRPSREHFPAASRSVAKVVVDHDSGARESRFYDARGRETTEEGVPLSEWRDDDLFKRVRPGSFLHEGLEYYLRKYHGIQKRPPRVRALDELEEVWGVAPPADLVRAVTLLASVKDRIFELRPSFGSPRLPPKSKNLVEELIVQDQKGPLPVALVEPLAGVVRFGETTSGDPWHFGLFDPLHSDARGEGQVYPFDRDERQLGDPITPDLSIFLYLNCVCEARARGVLSHKAFQAAYRKLKNRVRPTWHYAELEASVGQPVDEAERYKSVAVLPRFLFFRGLWISYLLRHRGGVSVEDLPRVFVESANEPITEQSWPGWLERAPQSPPNGLYLLFRCFFFDDEPRLAEAVRVCERSPSRLVRDGARLVSELQDGRKQLGTIRNVQKLRAELLALDLDPNRREQRERARQREEAARGLTRTGAVRAATAAAIDAGVGLEDLAWEKLDDAPAHEEVLKAMRRRPELAETIAIVDYVDHDGHAHDNLILEHERTEALLALGELGDPAVVPLLVGRARRGDRKAVEMLAAMKDPRAVPHLLALLDGKTDRYHHFDTTVVHALGAHGARGAVPRLLELLAKNPLTDWRSGIERGDLVQEIVLALGALGDRAAVPALLQLLSATNREYDEVLPLAAGALGALGAKEAIGPLAARIDRTRDAASAEDVWAYGELASRSAEDKGPALARLAAVASLDPAAEVVRAAAVAKLGGDRAPYVEALGHALSAPGYRKVDTSRARIWAWRCYGELGGPPVDPPTIRQFLTTDDHDVRAAATRALARRGTKVPEVRHYFAFVLDRMLAEDGIGALHVAVRDPWGVFRYNVALRLARIGDPTSVPVLAAALRELYEEPATSTYEYDDPPYYLRWFARALGSFGAPEGTACLVEGLSSRNHHMRQVIASDPPKDDRVVPALVRLLDDPNAVLRARAQHALEAFKRSPAYARAMEERDRIAEA